jgi:hypothetical protein
VEDDGGKTATASRTITVTETGGPPPPFTLTTAPSTANVIQGQSASYTITLHSANGFSQLAALSVSGLPVGVTAKFKPQFITTGQTALLTITTPSTQAPQAIPLTASASASVNSQDVTQSVGLTLNVLPITTSFLGRTVVDDTLQTPLAGVTVTLLGIDGTGKDTGCTGHSTVSDAAGNFMFTNLPPECTGGQLIRYNGTTTTAPSGQYAGVDLFYNLVPDQVTVSPVLIHPYLYRPVRSTKY